jgi:hypothetical protein
MASLEEIPILPEDYDQRSVEYAVALLRRRG